jgi:hypothetical protein
VAWFKKTPREPINYNDPLLDDASWLRAGERRYEELIRNHYGSPDTIAGGGSQRLHQGDPAAALFFFQKATDTMHSIYVCGSSDTGPASWARQPNASDFGIVDSYLQTLGLVRGLRPAAPLKASVVEVTHRLRAISTKFKQCGLDPNPYLDRLNKLGQLAPDIDVSGVFWS